ncbi:MAG: hypothetical protein DRZ79_00825 [Candidatus Cloacimonadota bacterium]|nr:MAG: hypothetical protein DRZ79_00825 [Candidatus Cloacimonadota bacterium]
MKNIFFLILMFSVGTLLGNSAFSFSGMPHQYLGNDVYGIGMGETGLADMYRINTDYYNPSLASTANKVIFSTAVSLGYIWYGDKNGNNFRDNGLTFPYFTIAIPVAAHKFAFSFNSFLSGNLENQIGRSWENLNYTEINRIDADVYKANFIYAFKNRFLNFGLAVNYYLGHRTRFWELDFDEEDYSDAKYEIEKNFKNPGFSVGINKKIGNLSLAAVYISPTKLDGSTYFKYVHSPYQDTLSNKMENLEIAEQIAGGLTVKFLEKFKASCDFYYEFQNKTDSFDFDAYKIAFGFAYDPLSGYNKWYKKIPFRFGGYNRLLPFEENGQKIFEKSFTIGSSIPLKSEYKKIDLALKFMWRGDLDKNSLRDKSVMLNIGISGFDIFSKRTKRIAPREIPKADIR